MATDAGSGAATRGIYATGQAADMTSSPEHAMTAPGSPPAVPGTQDWTDPDSPAVVPQHYARPVRVHAADDSRALGRWHLSWATVRL
jgi:hypothetical protein